jgi:hypothetical protein
MLTPLQVDSHFCQPLLESFIHVMVFYKIKLQRNMVFQKANFSEVSTLTQRYVHFD